VADGLDPHLTVLPYRDREVDEMMCPERPEPVGRAGDPHQRVDAAGDDEVARLPPLQRRP
jgi:hypothetical protein